MANDRPAPAEVLGFIAENEGFERTLAAFPALEEGDLRALLRSVARAARSREDEALRAAAEPATGGRSAAGARRGAPAGKGPAPRGVDTSRLRVFSDGAARGNPGPAGAGAVIYAADGRVLERLGRYLGRKTNNQAEYEGLLLGIERALALGGRELDVLADSELLVRQLKGEYRVRNEGLKPLWKRARELLARFERVRIAHVPREQNVEADEMSNRAIDERM